MFKKIFLVSLVLIGNYSYGADNASNPPEIIAKIACGEVPGDDNKKALDCLSKRQLDQAIVYFISHTNKNPNDSLALARLATQYTHLGRHEEAIPAYKNAIKKSWISFDFASLYARSLFATGDKEEAIKWNRRALELAPDCSGCRQELASQLREMGRTHEALKLLSDYNEVLKSKGKPTQFRGLIMLLEDDMANPPDIITKIGNEICSISLTGRTNSAMLVEFNKQVLLLENENCLEKSVILNSAGGELEPAYQIGRIVRKKGYNTRVKISQYCNSACGLIFIAGVERIVEKTYNFEKRSLVGFHSFGISGKCILKLPDSNLVEEKYVPFQLKTYNYAVEMLGRETGIEFGKLIYSIPCEQMVYANPDKLVEYNFATKVVTVKG